MKLGESIKREKTNFRIVERLPTIKEESDESASSNASSSSSSSSSTSPGPIAASVTELSGRCGRLRNQTSDSAIKAKLKKLIAKKQSEIFDHYDNIGLLIPLENAKNIAEEKREKLQNDVEEEQKKLKNSRKKRCKIENLFDRQMAIANLESKNSLLVKARLIFFRRLDEVDLVLISAKKIINKDIAKTEKKLLVKSKAVAENELFINATKNEIAILEKSIKINAADLYTQVLRIEKENKKLGGQEPIFSHPNIKNGKYLLMPLLSTGQFHSFGAQLAYQARRLKKQASKAGTAESATPADYYGRIEI